MSVFGVYFMLTVSFPPLDLLGQTRQEWQGVFLIASMVHYGGVVFYGVFYFQNQSITAFQYE